MLLKKKKSIPLLLAVKPQRMMFWLMSMANSYVLWLALSFFVPAVSAGRVFCSYFDEQSSPLFLTSKRDECSISVTMALLT